MILYALSQYYQRLLDDSEATVSDYGFGRQGVHFCLSISPEGDLMGRPLDLRDEKGRAKKIEVPGPMLRAAGVASNFAWDNTGYVLGADAKGKPERTAETHAAFKSLVKTVLDGVDDIGAKALVAFLEKWDPAQAETLPDWEEMIGWNIVFMLDGEPGYLHDRPAFREAWVRHLAADTSKPTGMCLVTGETGNIALTHPKIKGVPGSQMAGASLVSFNIDSAESFGKKQSLNAPVSDHAAFAYTTALNYLLEADNGHKVQLGETTIVFWSDGADEAEKLFGCGIGAKRADDETLVTRLELYLSALVQGQFPDALGSAETPFYVLGISPNAARLSVRFWLVGTVGSMAENLGAHYRALAIKPRFDTDFAHPSPWQLLRELAPQRDGKNISPLLSGQFVRAITLGQPYPQTILTAALGRIRIDKEMNYLRAALIKAFLVRNRNQEIHMTLDTTNTDIGYRFGRLFAIVERIQELAIKNANATVRDRFFASAMATPGRTFPVILKNAQHGLAKIRKDSKGMAINLEKQIQEIVGGLDSTVGFPSSLSSEKQGLFIIGYYQQRQDFFTKKDEKLED
ncbi:type I-C CRISPR-associated protein Cas8c/Csd1 [Pseudodesulfovibrio sp. JC047]|uniref:type I-C CRISPR-associated protein Cas8c/Csd1 n=1 Tax=Pseudodesulfovibrio sp. JC047 TaxID=2683199 RepID=UPI0013D50305|nr:type I-C CRISPR-associated protein Cas8c/Csd1 [Pseudodesulfovibrio sp. JC047]NDV19074.1 type I-C CRISPR-associated protein Cas8c/Csd1 [Pseudodesulfovibrio sp. JC047]